MDPRLKGRLDPFFVRGISLFGQFMCAQDEGTPRASSLRFTEGRLQFANGRQTPGRFKSRALRFPFTK